MVPKLNDLDELSVWGHAADHDASAFQSLEVFIVEFIPMTVTFGNFIFPIGVICERAILDFAWIRAQAHAAALIAGDIAFLHRFIAVIVPLFNEINYRMGRLLIKF